MAAFSDGDLVDAAGETSFSAHRVLVPERQVTRRASREPEVICPTTGGPQSITALRSVRRRYDSQTRSLVTPIPTYGAALIDRSVMLNTHLATAWRFSGMIFLASRISRSIIWNGPLARARSIRSISSCRMVLHWQTSSPASHFPGLKRP
jgi:hypothetical protein